LKGSQTVISNIQMIR